MPIVGTTWYVETEALDALGPGRLAAGIGMDQELRPRSCRARSETESMSPTITSGL